MFRCLGFWCLELPNFGSLGRGVGAFGEENERAQTIAVSRGCLLGLCAVHVNNLEHF